MRVGIAHHLGWATCVAATDDHEVVDRRRIDLLSGDLPNAPVHHEGGSHPLHRTGPAPTDEALADLVAAVRASARTTTGAELDALADALPRPIASVSLRDWPADFPSDVATQRRAPHESRADSIMYLQVLAEAAVERGWTVHRYDHRQVEDDAARLLGRRAEEVLHGPRARLGPPWTKDHRMALAATIVCPR